MLTNKKLSVLGIAGSHVLKPGDSVTLERPLYINDKNSSGEVSLTVKIRVKLTWNGRSLIIEQVI